MRTYCLLPIVSALLLIFTSSVVARVPVTTNDTYSVTNNTTLSISAPGVLANDFDSNSHTMTVSPIVSRTFTFNGITFDQAFTPNSFQSLAVGIYSNAVVTHEPTSAATEVTGFPDSTTDFLGLLSVGHLWGDEPSASGTKALNLPAGNLGGSRRSGFELGWSSGVMLTNLSGDDLVVFEAGVAGVAEAFMVQVRNAADGVWSPWVYMTPQSYANYNGRSDGLHSTKFNLDGFGISAGGIVDRIRLVNVRPEDRMVTGGEGVVKPNDGGAGTVPAPPGGQSAYTASELDPDIAYVGILHTLGATIPAYTATSTLGATVVVNSNGSFTYDPSTSSTLQSLNPGQSQNDTFTYLVTDSASGHAMGQVTVTVWGPAGGPMLTITPSGSEVVIRWANTPGFVLEATASLSEPDWAEVETVPTVDSGDLTVTLDASTGMSFFRLASAPPG